MSLDEAYVQQLTRTSLEGEKAKRFILSDEWTWLHDRVFKTLEDEAMETLRKSKTENDRLLAQQMFLASSKAKQILEGLVTQGEAARATLSTQLQEDDNNV